MSNLILYGVFAGIIGAGLGAIVVRWFYRPASIRGFYLRIQQQLWSGMLIAFGGMFAAEALGVANMDLAIPGDQQRATSAGLFVGYTLSAGAAAIRRRRRAQAHEVARSVSRPKCDGGS